VRQSVALWWFILANERFQISARKKDFCLSSEMKTETCEATISTLCVGLQWACCSEACARHLYISLLSFLLLILQSSQSLVVKTSVSERDEEQFEYSEELVRLDTVRLFTEQLQRLLTLHHSTSHQPVIIHAHHVPATQSQLALSISPEWLVVGHGVTEALTASCHLSNNNVLFII